MPYINQLTVYRANLPSSRKAFELAQAPAAVVNNAKLAILDCLGVSVLATSQEIGNCLSQFAKANVSPGNCSVWGMNIKASVRDAAFLNGTLAHGLDYDDRNHSTTYTLAASFARRKCRRKRSTSF